MIDDEDSLRHRSPESCENELAKSDLKLNIKYIARNIRSTGQGYDGKLKLTRKIMLQK